jgi:catechol 2,3-dioxygenase-like lactoylglutathione lyase family enzyme
MTEWFARPVLHVSNVEASLRFYVDRLGFTVPWRLLVGRMRRPDDHAAAFLDRPASHEV